MNISEFRQKYPQYDDMSDEELAKSFHQKYYSDMDYGEFSGKFLGGSRMGKSESTAGQFGQMMGAIPESLVRGALSGTGQVLGGAAGLIKGMIPGGKGPLEQAQETSENWQKAVDYRPIFEPTEFLEKEVLGPAYEGLRGKAGEALEAANAPSRMVQRALGVSPETIAKQAAAARTIGEVGLDVGFAAEGAHAFGKGVKRAVMGKDKKPTTSTPEPAPQEPQYVKGPSTDTLTSQLDLDLEDPRAAAIDAARREAAQGELATMAEQQAFRDRALSGQGDLFTQPGLEPAFRGTDTLASQLDLGIEDPRAAQIMAQRRANAEGELQSMAESQAFRNEQLGQPDLFARTGFERTPGLEEARGRQPDLPGIAPEGRLNRGDVSYDPNSPTMGLEATTTRGVGQELGMPEVRFEPPMEQGPYASLVRSGFENADPRLVRAIENDSILKGMLTKLKKAEDMAARVGEQQGGLMAEYGDRRVRGQQARARGQELVAFTKSIEALRKDAEKMRGLVDKRIKAHQERISKTPTIEKTYTLPKSSVTSPKVNALPGGPGSRQRGAIAPDLLTFGLNKLIRHSPKKEPQLPKMSRNDVLEAAQGETRGFREFLGTVAETLQDLPDTVFQKGLEYASNAQMVFHNSKNPVVKFIADRVANERSMAGLSTDIATEGVNIGGRGLFLPKKIIDPNSPKAHFDGMTPKERTTAMEIINKYSGLEEVSPDMMRSMGASQKVIDAIKKLESPIKQAIYDINAELIKMGKTPMKVRPFYFMRAQGSGNWLVRVKDAEGNTIAFRRAETAHGARQISAELNAQFGKEGYTTEVAKADARTQGNKYSTSPSLLEDIYNSLEKEDPRRKAILSAAAEIASRAGTMGKRRAFRKGVQGMDLTPENFMKTYEGYLTDAYNYIGNLRLSTLMNEITLTKDVPPRLKQWSLDYLNRARGGGEPKEVIAAVERGLDNILAVATRPTGFETAPGAARKLLKASNRLFTSTALFYGNIPFLVGQALQSTAFSPAILSRYKYSLRYEGGSVMKSFFSGPLHMFDRRNAEFQGIVDFLSARGKIDPTLIKEFQLFDAEGVGKKAQSAWSYFPEMSFIPRKLEGLNRVHAASVAYDFLKDNGLTGKALKVEVERMVDDMMGNYSMSDRPGMVTRHGIFGEAISPLLTFKNWFTGMTAVMMKEAMQGAVTGNWSRAVPLFNMWASTLIFGGVMGSLAFKELDMIWDLFKTSWLGKEMGLNEKSPSLTESILTSTNLPDWGKFGVITGATKALDPRGAHISGSMAAPEFMPSFATHGLGNLAPGAQWLASNAVGGWELLKDALGAKELTIEEKRAIFKGLIPNQYDKILNNLDTDFSMDGSGREDQLGFDRPTPSGPRGQGGVERKDAWEIGASILGSGTIPEFSEKAALRDIKDRKEGLTQARTHLVDLTVDALMNGKDISKYIDKAEQIGFSDFNTAVQLAYKNRLRTESDRQVGTGRNPTQYEKYQYIKGATGQ